MTENKYLNEQKYKKAENILTLIAFLVLIVGLCIGGFLIYRGIAKPGTAKVEKLKLQLEKKKSELESKGIKYDEFAEYSDGEAYDLKIVTEALDPSTTHCDSDEYKNNTITKEYCAAKNSVGEAATVLSIMFGIVICVVTMMIFESIIALAKGRYLFAFGAQQLMPIAKEVDREERKIAKERINEMSPTIGNAAGNIAEEIAKGIKKGLNDTDNK